MKIVDIREKTCPIQSPIRNAFIDFSKMTLSLVAVVTDVIREGKPVVGFGFNSNGRYGQGALIRERFRPRVLEADTKTLLDDTGENLDPHNIWSCMMTNEKPGGHGERSVAVGTIDMAVWDAMAKIAGKPLFRLLAEKYGKDPFSPPPLVLRTSASSVEPGRNEVGASAERSESSAGPHPTLPGSTELAEVRSTRGGEEKENFAPSNPRVFVYAAGGYYYPGKDLSALQDEMKSYLNRGYTVVKMKIGGASMDEDQRRIEAVMKILKPGQRLAVDANGRFDLPTAIAYGNMLLPYDLFWYEEAGDPLDYQLQSELTKHYPKPMATGENLFSMQDARNLIRHGGMRKEIDWLQFDCALSYGLVEYLRTLKMLRENGWSPTRCIPHGGHQMSLNIAAGLGLGGNESYPDLFQPFGGFPDRVAVENGYVTMPELVGIGFEGKAELIGEMRKLGE